MLKSDNGDKGHVFGEELWKSKSKIMSDMIKSRISIFLPIYLSICLFEFYFIFEALWSWWAGAKLGAVTQGKLTYLLVWLGEFRASNSVQCCDNPQDILTIQDWGNEYVFGCVSCLLVNKVTEFWILSEKKDNHSCYCNVLNFGIFSLEE